MMPRCFTSDSGGRECYVEATALPKVPRCMEKPRIVMASLKPYVFGWRGLILLAIYPIQIARLAINGKRSARENWLRAAALVVGKFAEMLGQMKYLTDRIRKVKPRLIEYK